MDEHLLPHKMHRQKCKFLYVNSEQQVLQLYTTYDHSVMICEKGNVIQQQQQQKKLKQPRMLVIELRLVTCGVQSLHSCSGGGVSG